MKKNAKKTSTDQAASAASQRTLQLSALIRRNLYAFVIEEGMKALDELLEQDRERLCGPSHAKGSPLRIERTSNRFGRSHENLPLGS